MRYIVVGMGLDWAELFKVANCMYTNSGCKAVYMEMKSDIQVGDIVVDTSWNLDMDSAFLPNQWDKIKNDGHKKVLQSIKKEGTC